MIRGDEWKLSEIDLWALFPAARTVTAKARAVVSYIEKTLPDLTDD